MNQVEIFTDGACRGNPGMGGWGAIIRINEKEDYIYGGDKNTTNNRMELTAAIKALEFLEKSSEVVLTTDSEYVKNGITDWIKTWENNGWRTANKKPVKNKECWLQLDVEVQRHQIEWKWVKGHSGHPENERADALANEAIADNENRE